MLILKLLETSMEAKRHYYWNLHRSIWSEMLRSKVIGHHPNVVLYDCEFKVRQSGRERVLRENKKNVHAFVVSNGDRHYPDVTPDGLWGNWVTVAYNPFKAGHFYAKASGNAVTKAEIVVLCADKRVLAYKVE